MDKKVMERLLKIQLKIVTSNYIGIKNKIRKLIDR